MTAALDVAAIRAQFPALSLRDGGRDRIYFDIPAKQEILRRMRTTLAPGGYMMLGAAETTLNIDPSWKPIPYGHTVAYQTC